MNKGEIAIEVIARHNAGQDIESIARQMRLDGSLGKVDIHLIGGIVGAYINRLAVAKGECVDTVYGFTACKMNGVISAGSNFVMCPLFRKPEKEITDEQ